jgi:hypothetical protein
MAGLGDDDLFACQYGRDEFGKLGFGFMYSDFHDSTPLYSLVIN